MTTKTSTTSNSKAVQRYTQTQLASVLGVSITTIKKYLGLLQNQIYPWIAVDEWTDGSGKYYESVLDKLKDYQKHCGAVLIDKTPNNDVWRLNRYQRHIWAIENVSVEQAERLIGQKDQESIEPKKVNANNQGAMVVSTNQPEAPIEVELIDLAPLAYNSQYGIDSYGNNLEVKLSAMDALSARISPKQQAIAKLGQLEAAKDVALYSAHYSQRFAQGLNQLDQQTVDALQSEQ
jgi:transcriptional regulator with XRE-family HTH domain